MFLACMHPRNNRRLARSFISFSQPYMLYTYLGYKGSENQKTNQQTDKLLHVPIGPVAFITDVYVPLTTRGRLFSLLRL